MDRAEHFASILRGARERGVGSGMDVFPPIFDHVSMYAGVVSRCVELAKLVSTEQRDLKVIDTHHQIELAQITSSMTQIENMMIAGFRDNESDRQMTYKLIDKLIDAGQYDVGLKMYERLQEAKTRFTLATFVDASNMATSGAGIRLTRR